MTDHRKLLKAGDILIDVIRDTQAKFSQAVYFINCKPAKNLTRGQREEYIKQRNQACLDIITYKLSPTKSCYGCAMR